MSPIEAMQDSRGQARGQTSVDSFRQGVRAVLLGPPGSGKGTQVSGKKWKVLTKKNHNLVMKTSNMAAFVDRFMTFMQTFSPRLPFLTTTIQYPSSRVIFNYANMFFTEIILANWRRTK